MSAKSTPQIPMLHRKLSCGHFIFFHLTTIIPEFISDLKSVAPQPVFFISLLSSNEQPLKLFQRTVYINVPLFFKLEIHACGNSSPW